jgi:hypothetical protein
LTVACHAYCAAIVPTLIEMMVPGIKIYRKGRNGYAKDAKEIFWREAPIIIGECRN